MVVEHFHILIWAVFRINPARTGCLVLTTTGRDRSASFLNGGTCATAEAKSSRNARKIEPDIGVSSAFLKGAGHLKPPGPAAREVDYVSDCGFGQGNIVPGIKYDTCCTRRFYFAPAGEFGRARAAGCHGKACPLSQSYGLRAAVNGCLLARQSRRCQ